MKRNFGSLNLAALDLNSAFQTGDDSTECSLTYRFSALNPSAEDCSMDTSGSEHSSDENVGFPMERLDMTRTDVYSSPHSFREETLMDQDMENVMPELNLPSRSRSETPTSDVPQHLHDQHHVELNALRCLSLKAMLTNLSTSSNINNTSNSSIASNKPSYSYPGVNERAKTTLLPIRQPSLQSV